MFVGVGAARVRDLFEQARTRAPAIVFIDEIDALGTRRDHGGFAGSDEREQTLNQLLAEMDGFDQSAGVVVLAATNRPDALDPALRRPGRFDREVIVPLPNRAERSCHPGRPTPAARTSAQTPTWTRSPPPPPDSPARTWPTWSTRPPSPRCGPTASPSPLPTSTVPAIACCSAPGTRSPLAPGELATVAVHEAGHALVATLSPYADPVSRVTVLGAGQALGLTETLPADDRRLYGESYLADTLAVRLGGRAAERLIRGEASTGAADDLASATALATQMVREFGLSEAIGPVSYGGPPPGYPATGGRTRLLRAHPVAGRPGSRRLADQGGKPAPGTCSPATGRPSPSSPPPCSSRKPSPGTASGPSPRRPARAATDGPPPFRAAGIPASSYRPLATTDEPPSSTKQVSR